MAGIRHSKVKTMLSEDVLIHYAVLLDTIYWRPRCRIMPETFPHSWQAFMNKPVTCIACAAVGEW